MGLPSGDSLLDYRRSILKFFLYGPGMRLCSTLLRAATATWLLDAGEPQKVDSRSLPPNSRSEHRASSTQHILYFVFLSV
jgi:hypothetical protein